MACETEATFKSAVAYVYTTEQESEDAAVLQKGAAREIAAALLISSIAFFEDHGKARPNYLKMLETINTRKVDYIIVQNYRRINQYADEAEKIVKEFEQHGARVIFTG